MIRFPASLLATGLTLLMGCGGGGGGSTASTPPTPTHRLDLQSLAFGSVCMKTASCSMRSVGCS